MQVTQTQTSDCLYNNWIAADLSLHITTVLPTACLLEHGYTLFQGLQSIYTPLWHIPMISQKLDEGRDLVPGGSSRTKPALCVLN